jgi:hypothetical protein
MTMNRLMMNRLLLTACCVLTVASLSVNARPALQVPDAETVAIPSSELEITYYTPRTTSTKTLLALAEELFGDVIYVQRASLPGRDGGDAWVSHFLDVQDTILIRDTNDQVLKIRAELQRLEDSLAHDLHGAGGASQDAELVDWQYEPRHVSAATLDRALSRFHRSFTVFPPDGKQGENVQAQTIISLSDRNMLLVHETPGQIKKIKAFIEGIDQPAPQVTITYYVVTGHADANVQRNGRAIPEELVANLRRLVPAEVYQLELTGVLRSSVSGKMVVEDDLRQMEMQLEPASFNPQGGTLALKTCRFEYQKRSFATSATLHRGEYTVLGAAGDNPVFLVLRLSVE